jgi:hypothetical protein
MASSGMLRRVALIRTNVSEELSAPISMVTKIGELGTLAVTNNRRTHRRENLKPYEGRWFMYCSNTDHIIICSISFAVF